MVETRIVSVTRHGGRRGVTTIGAVTAEVTYPGEPAQSVTFVGENGGRIVRLITQQGVARVIGDPYRFGAFGPAWVTRYYGGAA